MAKLRNYRKEYDEYHGTSEQKLNRALRNSARRKKGLKKGDGQEVDHINPLSKGGSNGPNNTRVVSRETNRKKGSKNA
jgi:5-methylcytosine-specific restriction endonuclease McrA